MKNILFFLFALVLMGGCTEDDFGGNFDKPLPEGKVRLTLHTNMGSFTKPVKTRASSADEDNMGNKAWVFILEKTNPGSEEYDLKIIENPDIKENGEVDIIIDEMTNPVTVVLLVNAQSKYIDESGTVKDFTLANLSHITSYSELKETLNTTALASPAQTVPYTPGGAIPMSGEVDLPTGISASSTVNVSLKRIVAKITVETELPSSQFQLLGASVCNAPRSGWLLPPRTLWRDNSTNLTNYEYDAIDCLATQADSKQTTASNPIYIYESRPEEQTAVIIKAVYRGNSYFYKLAMTADYSVSGGGDMQSKPKNFYYRNFAYKYIVTSVTGGGYATFQEACDGAPSNNIISAIDVIDLTSHDIIDNGSYFLGVSNSEYAIYSTGSYSNLLAVTLSSNAPADVAYGTVSVSGDGLSLQPASAQMSANSGSTTEHEVYVNIDAHFSQGYITVKLGNITKMIPVNRFHTLPAFGLFHNNYYSKEYVYGEVENSEQSDWLTLSRDNFPYSEGLAKLANNDGGIYFKVLPNIKNEGVSERSGVMYLSRRNSEGRLKVYLVQDKINTSDIEDDETELPIGFTPVVGAYWKASQTGERLIRIERPNNMSIDGYWYATVIQYGEGWNPENGDGIVMDMKMTEDRNVGWRTDVIPNESLVANGNDSGFDDNYKVTNPEFIQGQVSASTGGIYFRLGLQKEFTPTEAQPARYAVVLIVYTQNIGDESKFRPQRIFIRQGEDADYIFRPQDTYNGSAPRALAAKWSPYNLTDPAKNANYDFADRTEGRGIVPIKGGKFVDYPSQGGYYFSFIHRYAYNPIVYSENSNQVPPSLQNVSVKETNPINLGGIFENGTMRVDKDNINNLSATDIHELCPDDYRTPRDAQSWQIPEREVGKVQYSEVRQSLFVNPVDGDRPAEAGLGEMAPENQVKTTAGDNSGTIVGVYADGFMDRRKLYTPKCEIFQNVMRKNSAVALGDINAAYIGRLLFNPETFASIFFPYTGSLAPGELGNKPYYMGDHVVYMTSTAHTDNKYNHYHNGYQLIYIGYAVGTRYVPNLVTINPHYTGYASVVRCVKK